MRFYLRCGLWLVLQCLLAASIYGLDVGIGQNCQAITSQDFSKLTPDAAGLANTLKKLKANHPLSLDALITLDTELSVGTVSPELRKELNVECTKQWVGEKKSCILAAYEIKRKKSNIFDIDIVGIKKPILIISRTVEAKPCLEHLPLRKSVPLYDTKLSKNKLIADIKAIQTICSDVIEKDIKQDMFPRVFLKVLNNGKIYDSDFGFNMKLIFFSPNHSTNKVHAMNLISVLNQQKIDHFNNVGLGFKKILTDFGIQAIFLGIKDEAIAKQIKEAAALTRAKLYSPVNIDGFELKTHADFKNIMSKFQDPPGHKFLLVSPYQILVIDETNMNKAFLHLKPSKLNLTQPNAAKKFPTVQTENTFHGTTGFRQFRDPSRYATSKT